MHLAGLALEEGDLVGDQDAGEAAVEQLLQREVAAAVVHGHDDFVDAVFLGVFDEVAVEAHDAVFGNRHLFIAGRHECDELETALVGAAAKAPESCGIRARAVDQHADA